MSSAIAEYGPLHQLSNSPLHARSTRLVNSFVMKLSTTALLGSEQKNKRTNEQNCKYTTSRKETPISSKKKKKKKKRTRDFIYSKAVKRTHINTHR
jgi:hypothetical protein